MSYFLLLNFYHSFGSTCRWFRRSHEHFLYSSGPLTTVDSDLKLIETGLIHLTVLWKSWNFVSSVPLLWIGFNKNEEISRMDQSDELIILTNHIFSIHDNHLSFHFKRFKFVWSTRSTRRCSLLIWYFWDQAASFIMKGWFLVLNCMFATFWCLKHRFFTPFPFW